MCQCHWRQQSTIPPTVVSNICRLLIYRFPWHKQDCSQVRGVVFRARNPADKGLRMPIRLTSFRSAPSRWTSETDWHSKNSLVALPWHIAHHSNDESGKHAFNGHISGYLALPSVLWHCWLDVRKSIQPAKIEWWGVGGVICLERGVDCLHMVLICPFFTGRMLFLTHNQQCPSTEITPFSLMSNLLLSF